MKPNHPYADDPTVDTGDDAGAARPNDCGPLEPIVGGTLALLTYYARTPHLAAADKIARHLALIARHPHASAPLQTVCTRLFLDWLGPLQTNDEAPERQWRNVMPQPDAVQ